MKADSSCSTGRGRGRALLLVLACTLVLPACATKRDLRDLRDELVALQLRQDSMFRQTQAQNRLLLDTLRSAFADQLDQRGQTSHRFTQLEQSLVRLEEMVNQTQLLMAQLTERLDRVPAPTATVPGADPSTTGFSSAEAQTMYEAGVTRMQDVPATARSAFEQLLREYPNDPLAPDAQYQLAETYVLEQNYERAVEEMEKVEQQWPRSPRAPGAMLRAGIISLEQLDDRESARRYFEMVRSRFPGSEEYAEASRRLQAIGR
jgi:tol-pal system protein YbgF